MNDIVRKDRHLGLGGTDAKRIVEGDWLSLYLEKVGLRLPEDLSHVFKVQLGTYTEGFHINWLAKREGWDIRNVAERKLHPEHKFMFAHLDGWVMDFDHPIEVKHVRGGSSVRERAQYYMPQIQHYLAVTAAETMIFSIIAGNDEPDFVRVARNDEYIAELIDMETSFWWHVENKEAPDPPVQKVIDDMKTMATIIPIDGLRDYQMDESNEWAVSADDYIKFKPAATLFEEAKANLKGLMPFDAAKATGHGVEIRRSKNGSLRFY